MASISDTGWRGHHKFTLNVSTKETSTANNTSTVSFSFVLSPVYESWNWEQWGSKISYVININGTEYTGTIPNYDGYSSVTLKSGTLTVAHNADGTKTIPISFSVTDNAGQTYTCGNASASGTATLTTIPRYLSITSLTISNKVESYVVVSWKVSDPRDSTYYSFDNGETWIGSATDGETLADDLKSGTFYIKNLTAGTTYSIKVKIKRKDSQLWTISDTLTFSTYDYPHCSKTPDFTIGDKLTLEFYNPLKRYLTIEGYAKSNGAKIFSGTTSGTKLEGFNDSNSVNAQYASIPNAKSGGYKVVVLFGLSSTTKDYGNVYKIKGNEYPTVNGFDYTDGNSSVVAITGDSKQIVQNKSTLKATVQNATPNYGAGSISKYVVECQGISKTMTASGSCEIGTINSATDVSMKLTAYDSRGLTASKTITVKMVAHKAPTATVDLHRLNNYEDETYLTVDGSVSSVNGKNGMTITYRYKLSGGSYGSFATIADRTKQTLSLDKNNSYIVNVVVTDSFGDKYDETFAIGKGVFPLFIDTVKNSVGVNCFPAKEKSFEVNGFNLYDVYRCEKTLLLSKGHDGLKISIDDFTATDKFALIVSGVANGESMPVFKIIRLRRGSDGNIGDWAELNLGHACKVAVSGKCVHITASQWSYFSVKAALGIEISLSNSAL